AEDDVADVGGSDRGTRLHRLDAAGAVERAQQGEKRPGQGAGDSRLSFDILIPADSVSGARMGYMVVVELTQRPTRRTKAVGK
ncbi:hypothetical protein, partial [Serratia sp. ME43]|uniref:hypothetical protein n=1 Tax=Serratia sp. ME43 TaxID=2744256 RepID=UPI00351B9867